MALADQCVLSTDLCYVRPWWIICLKGRISSQHRQPSRRQPRLQSKEIPWKYTACLPSSMCTLKIYFQKETSTFISQTLRIWNLRAHIFLPNIFVQTIFMLFEISQNLEMTAQLYVFMVQLVLTDQCLYQIQNEN